MSDQSEPVSILGKILQGGDGIGTVSPEMVEGRARELAKIDGRTEVNEGDRATAEEDLLGSSERVAAPEALDSDTEDLIGWDDAPDSTGVRAHRVLPEDDTSISQTLVEEGLDEADHDQRLSAAEENPPEEL